MADASRFDHRFRDYQCDEDHDTLDRECFIVALRWRESIPGWDDNPTGGDAVRCFTASYNLQGILLNASEYISDYDDTEDPLDLDLHCGCPPSGPCAYSQVYVGSGDWSQSACAFL